MRTPAGAGRCTHLHRHDRRIRRPDDARTPDFSNGRCHRCRYHLRRRRSRGGRRRVGCAKRSPKPCRVRVACRRTGDASRVAGPEGGRPRPSGARPLPHWSGASSGVARRRARQHLPVHRQQRWPIRRFDVELDLRRVGTPDLGTDHEDPRHRRRRERAGGLEAALARDRGPRAGWTRRQLSGDRRRRVVRPGSLRVHRSASGSARSTPSWPICTSCSKVLRSAHVVADRPGIRRERPQPPGFGHQPHERPADVTAHDVPADTDLTGPGPSDRPTPTDRDSDDLTGTATITPDWVSWPPCERRTCRASA